MLNKEELKTLEELTQLYGPSGDEQLVKEYLKARYQELGFETLEDNLGSVVCVKKSKKENAKKVLLLAHMDEVGFMVCKILENGAVMVLPLGGHNNQALLSNRVLLKTQKGDYYKGLINALPPHLLQGKDYITQVGEMIFDFGFTSKKEAMDAGVRIGDSLICEGPFEVLNEGKRLLSKAFDDRLGLALGLEVLKELLPIFEALDDYSNDSLYNTLLDYVAKKECKNGYAMWPVRTAVSGKQMTPAGATEIMEVLGKEESLNRIRKGIELLENALSK